jgi:transcriptional regulator with XRE-family HTH domain
VRISHTQSDTIDWNGLADRIRGSLAQRGMSQREFARAAGVSPVAVHKWLKGGCIAPDNWRRVATALGLGIDELLGLKESDESHGPSRFTHDGKLDGLLTKLARLSNEPLDQAIPDLMMVLRDAQRYAEQYKSR